MSFFLRWRWFSWRQWRGQYTGFGYATLSAATPTRTSVQRLRQPQSNAIALPRLGFAQSARNEALKQGTTDRKTFLHFCNTRRNHPQQRRRKTRKTRNIKTPPWNAHSPFTGRLQDLVPFVVVVVVVVDCYPTLFPHSHHLVFSFTWNSTHLAQSPKDIDQKLTFSRFWRNVMKRSIFGEVLLFCFFRKWLIFMRLCDQRTGIFCLFFWNWLYSSVHYHFLCLFSTAFAFFLHNFDFATNLLLKAFFYKRRVSYFL